MSRSFRDYLDAFESWMDTIVKVFNFSEASRPWTYIGSFYNDALTKQAMVSFFDRQDKNKIYTDEVENINSAKGYAHLEMEINSIYGSHKCFAQRHKTRLQYYEDDLSNKGCRIGRNLNKSIGRMNHFYTSLAGGAKATTSDTL